MDNTPRCEHLDPNAAGVACGAFARWRVSRLYRKADAQNSCSRHLAVTVTALIGIDEGDRATVTVSRARVTRD